MVEINGGYLYEPPPPPPKESLLGQVKSRLGPPLRQVKSRLGALTRKIRRK